MVTEFRIARTSDLIHISSFLRCHWRKDHVFVQRPELLIWQHSSEKRDGLNFILAVESDEIVGLLGFIPFRKFDGTLRENTISLALWKVSDASQVGTGVGLLRYLLAEEKPTRTISIGLSDIVVPIYRALRFSTGVMDHFVIFRPGLDFSQITGQSVKQGKTTLPALQTLGRSLDLDKSLIAKVETMLRANSPEKSVKYYRERFEQHPWFRYSILILGRNTNPELLLVLREVSVGGASLLRIVDIGGDVNRLPQVAGVLRELLIETDTEYVDIVMNGVDSEEMIRNGFSSTETDIDLMLPNFFDPFERRIIDVAYAVKSSVDDSSRLHLHPADTDQDRPNS